MNEFFSEFCESGACCATCRDRAGGKMWRESLQRCFSDVAETDFQCPSGKPWGFASAVGRSGQAGVSYVDPSLLSMDFDHLSALVEASGDEDGLKLLSTERIRLSDPKCPNCTRNGSAARLRVWLSAYAIRTR